MPPPRFLEGRFAGFRIAAFFIIPAIPPVISLPGNPCPKIP
jgi:hypothetical protein